ncbi:MAG: hypothetical protein R6W90_01985 [Ignavibacteriaceae bacterium]
MDVKPDSLLTSNSLKEHPDKFLAEGKVFTLQSNEASLLSGLLFGKNTDEVNTESLYEARPADEKLSGNVSHMRKFFEALKNSASSQVRVAHYGDSEIEGDLITADLRQNLQEQFGGKGAGFLSITSQDIAFRTSTKHSFSNNWNTISVFSGNPNKIPIGLDGSVSTPKGSSWALYETTGRFKNLRSFSQARVFYTNAKASASVKYSFDGKKETSAPLKSGSAVNELLLNVQGDAKSFKLTAADGSSNFFGVSLESGNGVYIDNFPLRGNTGVSIRDFSPQILKDFNKLLNYKLIILSFGLNIASTNITDFTWYEKEMIKVINLLKSSFPEASILVVSVGDKGIKRGSGFATDPNIPKLVMAQRNIAAKSGVAFWNLYQAMGGENSIAKWVNAKPPLAFKDYTHVNLQGAEKIAEMLTQALLDEYKKFN